MPENGRDAKHINMDQMKQVLSKANDAFARGESIFTSPQLKLMIISKGTFRGDIR